MSVRLESSDKKIVEVDQNVIKQMGTIQTMLDMLSISNNNNDEIVPIYAVNEEVLHKVIEWTKFHIEPTMSDSKAWKDQFFKTNLEKIFNLEEAADYLEINTLLVDGQVFMDRSFELIKTTEAFKNLSPEKLGVLLVRDSLNVPSEQTVFESLETWISADPEERSQCLGDLIPYIRATFLPSQFIKDVKNYLMKHSQPNLCQENRFSQFIEGVKNFFGMYSQPNLCQQLNFHNRTPRQGYDQCIVVLHRKREGGECLKYLDTKVGSIFENNIAICILDWDLDSSSRYSKGTLQRWM